LVAAPRGVERVSGEVAGSRESGIENSKSEKPVLSSDYAMACGQQLRLELLANLWTLADF
jgi:hypothetical protein